MNHRDLFRSRARWLLAGCSLLVFAGTLPGCTTRPRGGVYIKRKRKPENDLGTKPTQPPPSYLVHEPDPRSFPRPDAQENPVP